MHEILGGDSGVFQQLCGQGVAGEQLSQGLGLVRIRHFRLRENLGGFFLIAQSLGMLEQIGPQLGLGVREGLDVGGKAVFLQGGSLIQSVGIGGFLGNGQVVGPGHAVGLAQLDQTQNGLIFILVGLEEAGIKGEVVGRAAGDQGPAGAVRDDAAGGGDLFLPGDGTNGLGDVFVVVDDLCVVQDAHIDQYHQGQKSGQDSKTQVVTFLGIHSVSFNRCGGRVGRRPGKEQSWEEQREGSGTAPGRPQKRQRPRRPCCLPRVPGHGPVR